MVYWRENDAMRPGHTTDTFEPTNSFRKGCQSMPGEETLHSIL